TPPTRPPPPDAGGSAGTLRAPPPSLKTPWCLLSLCLSANLTSATPDAKRRASTCHRVNLILPRQLGAGRGHRGHADRHQHTVERAEQHAADDHQGPPCGHYRLKRWER